MIIDAHVHLVGNGSSGSGCWYRPHGLTRLAQSFMLGDYWRLRRIKNPLERDYQIKRTMGFREETFTRAANILRINHHEKPNSYGFCRSVDMLIFSPRCRTSLKRSWADFWKSICLNDSN